MNREEKRIVEGFRHWIDTNTERGVTTIPNSLCEKVYKLIVKKNPNIIEIPDNATNGDMIKALFDCKIVVENHFTYTVDVGKDYFWKNFEKDWWNAPYKKGEQE